jgi:hypothetical protein
MSSIATWLNNWRKQPSTLLGLGLVLGGGVYWFTKSPELTLVAIGVVPGVMNDRTKDLMAKIEGIEDGVRTANYTADRANGYLSIANGHLAALRRVTPGAEERLPPGMPTPAGMVIPESIKL